MLREETTATKDDPLATLAVPGRENLLLVQMARAPGARAEGRALDGPGSGFWLCCSHQPRTQLALS